MYPRSNVNFHTYIQTNRHRQDRFDRNYYHALRVIITRNSSGDEIANVNFLYDDIVHALKIQ